MPKSEQSNETYSFPTYQEHGDESQHAPLQKRILQELKNLQKIQQLNPQDSQGSRNHVLSTFDWTNSTLESEASHPIEALFVEVPDVFARHRFTNRIIEDLEVELTQ